MEGIWRGYLFFQKWYIDLGFPFIFSKIDLAQNKMEQQTRSPLIKDEAARRADMHHFPTLDLGGGGRV